MNFKIDDIQPVVLGTDLNTYGVARAFHEAYGIKSVCFGSMALLMVRDSHIIETHVIDHFSDDQVMMDALIKYGQDNAHKKLVLFAAGEHYVFKIFKYYDELEKYYHIPYVHPQLGMYLSDKMNFYKECEKHGIDYPRAVLVDKESYQTYRDDIKYPLILKPQESATYFYLDFPGKEKAYIIQNKEELDQALQLVYDGGYEHSMIIQEMVEGPVTNEMVVNLYFDDHSDVKLSSPGQILLDDPDPEMRGNYVAIARVEDKVTLKEYLEKVYTMLKKLGYTGLANLDLKIDNKDNKIKAFEINMRQGRSSYFSILAGANYAKAIVEDLLDETSELMLGERNFLWLNCSEKGFKAYAKKRNLPIEKYDVIGNTLTYHKDRSLFRNKRVRDYYQGYSKKINQY